MWCQPNYVEEYNVHHRLPRSRGGVDTPQNRSIVPVRLHEAYNALFGSNPTAQEVASILSAVWIDPSFTILVVPSDIHQN